MNMSKFVLEVNSYWISVVVLQEKGFADPSPNLRKDSVSGGLLFLLELEKLLLLSFFFIV